MGNTSSGAIPAEYSRRQDSIQLTPIPVLSIGYSAFMEITYARLFHMFAYVNVIDSRFKQLHADPEPPLSVAIVSMIIISAALTLERDVHSGSRKVPCPRTCLPEWAENPHPLFPRIA